MQAQALRCNSMTLLCRTRLGGLTPHCASWSQGLGLEARHGAAGRGRTRGPPHQRVHVGRVADDGPAVVVAQRRARERLLEAAERRVVDACAPLLRHHALLAVQRAEHRRLRGARRVCMRAYATAWRPPAAACEALCRAPAWPCCRAQGLRAARGVRARSRAFGHKAVLARAAGTHIWQRAAARPWHACCIEERSSASVSYCAAVLGTSGRRAPCDCKTRGARSRGWPCVVRELGAAQCMVRRHRWLSCSGRGGRRARAPGSVRPPAQTRAPAYWRAARQSTCRRGPTHARRDWHANAMLTSSGPLPPASHCMRGHQSHLHIHPA